MVNLLVAILISAAIGFLAGHFSTGGNDPSPVSLKEAVTGDLDAPPPQYNLPRPPPIAKSAPVMCQEGKTLQEQLGQMKFFEVQTLCREVERDWFKRNIEGYAPMAGTDAEIERARVELFEISKDQAQTSSYWKGEATFARGDKSVQIEIFVNYFNVDQQSPEQMKHPTLTAEDPAKLCTGFTPLFVVNGVGQMSGSMNGCGMAMRKKGDSYFYPWETFGDEALRPAMSAMLVPVPGARQTAIEILDSQTGQWVSDASFSWKASTWQDYEEARQRHQKKVEGR